MQVHLHLRDAPTRIAARSANGVHWCQIESTRNGDLTIFTETPEQANDIANGFRRAFGEKEITCE